MLDTSLSLKLTKILSVAIRSLRLQLFRAILSVLGIVCGVTAVFALICISEGAKQETLQQIEQLGVRNIIIKQKDLSPIQKKKSIEKLSKGLSLKDVEYIKQRLPLVETISALKVVEASIVGMKNEFIPQVMSTTAEYIRTQELEILKGRFLNQHDINKRKLVAVLGSNVAMNLGIDGKIDSYIRLEDKQFEIVGILKAREGMSKKSTVISPHDYNQMIFIPIGTEVSMMKRYASTNEISEIIIKIRDADEVLVAAKIVKRIMELSHRMAEDYTIIIPQELLKNTQQAQKTFNIVLGAIAGISLIVGGIGIMNIMLATVSERKKEIGIRRAVGANQFHILIQFLSEAVILTVIGGVLGLSTGLLFVWGISAFSGLETAVVPWSIALSLVMAMFTGLFSGLYPAIQASRINPIEALRYE